MMQTIANSKMPNVTIVICHSLQVKALKETVWKEIWKVQRYQTTNEEDRHRQEQLDHARYGGSKFIHYQRERDFEDIYTLVLYFDFHFPKYSHLLSCTVNPPMYALPDY